MLTDYDAQNRLLRITDVLALTGFRSRQSIYNLVKAGALPQPVKLRRGGRASGWRASDIYAYLARCRVAPLARPVKIHPEPDARELNEVSP